MLAIVSSEAWPNILCSDDVLIFMILLTFSIPVSSRAAVVSAIKFTGLGTAFLLFWRIHSQSKIIKLFILLKKMLQYCSWLRSFSKNNFLASRSLHIQFLFAPSQKRFEAQKLLRETTDLTNVFSQS